MTSEVNDIPEANIHLQTHIDCMQTQKWREGKYANLVYRASNNNWPILLFKRDILLLMQYYFLVLFLIFYCVQIFIIILDIISNFPYCPFSHKKVKKIDKYYFFYAMFIIQKYPYS
jgi:hypothetical protein